jgi:uncharacterized RDD family membrane protein YckC
MTAEEQYIDRVIRSIPAGSNLRCQIAMELRGHIAERLAEGEPAEEVLRKLGDPDELAEGYLESVPLVSASFGRRAVAKVLDAMAVAAAFVPVALLARSLHPTLWVFIAPVAALAFWIYIVWAEYRSGQTIGKRLMGLSVVRETGARISLGQSVMRQLPMLFQIFWVDILFALFTESRQRAFERVSRTRVVQM